MSSHNTSAPMHRMSNLATGLAALILLAASAAGAGGFLSPGTQNDEASKAKPKSEFVAPAKRMDVQGDGVEAKLAELKNAEMRVVEGWQNASTADAQLRRARTRRYPRGEALEEIRQQAIELGTEKVAAESNFLQTVEDARRAGVPMGTLSRYMDLADTIRSRQAARQAGG
jgi:hypothetical protein